MRIDAPLLPLDCSMQSERGRSAGAVPIAPLPKDLFATVVANAPLVAIDLIVQNHQGAVLLGLRNNPPAQGCWFVPGGRIRKGESLDTAFARIAKDELELQAQRSEHPSAGVYEHFYDVDFNGTKHASTHYIVLAYRLRIAPELLLPHHQHSRFQWMQPDRILQHPDVHPYTKAYFELT
jgi:colanic acid biosynthesis protein WcaH